MDILRFELTPFMMNCYVVVDGGEAMVIDPGESAPELLDALEGLSVKYIVNTHAHLDHVGGNQAVKDATGAPLLCHEADLPLLHTLREQALMFGLEATPSPPPDRLLREGDVLQVGQAAFSVRHAPGHSPGHVVLVGESCVFAGDVLFSGSIGRTDLPGGSMEQLLHSIRTKLLDLPDDMKVYCGHGPDTTIGIERGRNPFLEGL